jgi:hypothetical protein
MNVPEGVLRSYRPCRAKPQPPSGCNGQCAKLAERQSSRVTYSSPASPVSNRSCTGTGPAGLPPARAHLLKAQRQVSELTQSRRRRLPHRHTAHRSKRPPATAHHTQSTTAPVGKATGRGHVDDALARTGTARGQRGYTLPTARAFAHMPTASHPVRSKDPIQWQCYCALHHRRWTSRGHTLGPEQCGDL